MERKPVDKRRFYSKEEKEVILSKTNGRCAHCGKRLTIKTMEKDHSIPWSKGGPSDIENIVPLCKECNKRKADIVYEPVKYMKYLKKPYIDNMQRFFKRYLEDVEYLSLDNFLEVDVAEFEVQVPIVCGNGQPVYVKRKNTFSKALYYELDEVYKFLLNYNNTYNMVGMYHTNVKYDTPEEYIKLLISYFFTSGCILISRNNNREITTVLTLCCKNTMHIDSKSKRPLKYKDKIVMDSALSTGIFIDPKVVLKSAYNDMNTDEFTVDVSRFALYACSIGVIYNKIVSHAGDGRVIIFNTAFISEDKRMKDIVEFLEFGGNRPEYELQLYTDGVVSTYTQGVGNVTRYDNYEEFSKQFYLGMKFLNDRIKSYRGYEMDWNDSEDYISILDYAKEIGVKEEDFYERFYGKRNEVLKVFARGFKGEREFKK